MVQQHSMTSGMLTNSLTLNNLFIVNTAFYVSKQKLFQLYLHLVLFYICDNYLRLLTYICF